MAKTKSKASITAPKAFHAAAGTCGIKPSGAPDLAIIASLAPARSAALFTQNAFPGAPVIVSKKHIKHTTNRAFVINSGIANVATGKRGVNDAIKMCSALAHHLNCDPHQIIPASTGVIGDFLPITKITQGINSIAPHLSASSKTDAAVARAIMTTDTRPKSALRKIKLGSTTITIGAIAKGSGMIAPNMATMLCFITTDADISTPLLRAALTSAANAPASLNRLSIDSDTSTSDTVAILANAAAANTPIRSKNAHYKKFAAALTDLTCDLAYQIISDGEGATRVIRIIINSAKSDADALTLARSIADSPLVKTAVHGSDPNWGRIIMAAGKTNATINPDKLRIRIGNTTVFRNSRPTTFNPAAVSKSMKAPQVTIQLDLNIGHASTQFLACDLSRQYITINADYHT